MIRASTAAPRPKCDRLGCARQRRTRPAGSVAPLRLRRIEAANALGAEIDDLDGGCGIGMAVVRRVLRMERRREFRGIVGLRAVVRHRHDDVVELADVAQVANEADRPSVWWHTVCGELGIDTAGEFLGALVIAASAIRSSGERNGTCTICRMSAASRPSAANTPGCRGTTMAFNPRSRAIMPA